MKAYKATEKNMQCRGFQFEMNEEFIKDGEIELCEHGFHFCEKLIDVFNYYRFNPQNRFFEVEIPDDAEVIYGADKSVTNKIKFIRELSSENIKELSGGDVYIDTDGGYVVYGNKCFYNENGKLHRIGGPAIIRADGGQEWYQNGLLHCEDGPAIVYADGRQEWWQNDERHRIGGPAIIRADGGQEWYQNGNLHRVNGPAVIYVNGNQEWWQNGKRHRVDGPARIYANGEQEFWINGIRQNESL